MGEIWHLNRKSMGDLDKRSHFADAFALSRM